MSVHVAVLAAGKGTRMRSTTPKVLHRVAGIPMISHVLRHAAALHPQSTVVVVGHEAPAVEAALANHPALTFVVQEPQLGTGHALLTTADVLGKQTGTLVVLSGDVPLLSAETLGRLVERHESTAAVATVLTATVDNPHGYGRIVRQRRFARQDSPIRQGSSPRKGTFRRPRVSARETSYARRSGPARSRASGHPVEDRGSRRTRDIGDQIARIVEERDASSTERAIHEINSGIYAFALEGLFDALHDLAPENDQREYYLTDLIGIFKRRSRRVETVSVANPDEIRGINSRSELAAVSRIMRDRKSTELMAAGVSIEDPATTYIDADVQIGADTIVHPGVSIQGRTIIGSGCEIHSGSRIADSAIGDHVTVLDHSLVIDSRIANDARIGPFAHLRNQADVREGARVGNFVELKKTTLGPGSKSMHLAYLGDAVIGANVNIGAGTITCNFDGVRKQQTTIGDGAFVGSDSQLVAPVTIGEGAYVGSGATIREDVPPGALAVSAGKQRNIEDWAKKRSK